MVDNPNPRDSKVDVLTVVPPSLKKLVRLVARSFYHPEHFLVLDILAKHPCVTEDDLLQLLRFDYKKLRVILAFLKKDKLIKNIQRIESIVYGTGTTGDKKNITMQYYYINYKVFVNVVKYKLHRIREKIQTEERKSRNRMLYVCPHCHNTYTDLDVDRLLDPVEQVLKCTMCGTVLEEDLPEGNVVDARSLLSSLNDQLQPILQLLKETENINLAPELLEPEPRGINKHLLEAARRHRGQQSSKTTDQWNTSRADDMYGDQAVSINIGDDNDKKKKGKAAPQWMTESTVYTSSDNKVGGDSIAMDTGSKSNVSDGDIVALLMNESKRSKQHIAPPTITREDNSSSSEDESTSEEEMDEGMGSGPSGMGTRHLESGSSLNFKSSSYDNEEESSGDEFESDEDELAMKVGSKLYQINDITPDIVAQMTTKEKQKYTEVCQQAYNNYF